MESSVGSVSRQCAVTETINGLYKTEVTRYCGSCVVSKKRSLLLWNGWAGLIIVGYWSRLGIFRQQNLKWHIVANEGSQLMQLDPNQTVSGKIGTIQS